MPPSTSLYQPQREQRDVQATASEEKLWFLPRERERALAGCKLKFVQSSAPSLTRRVPSRGGRGSKAPPVRTRAALPRHGRAEGHDVRSVLRYSFYGQLVLPQRRLLHYGNCL